MSGSEAASRGREEARRWLEQAQDDLRWAKHLADAGAYNIACFLAQQVGEKALKALLYHQGEELVFGHSVQELCERASVHLPEVGERCQDWGYLDNFYVATRYPNALPGSIPAKVYTQKAAQEAVATASDIVAFVAGRVGEA